MHDTTTIAKWRKTARTRLKPLSAHADREADLLLEAVLGLSRAQLFTRDTEVLAAEQLVKLNHQLERLENDEPLAYVLGEQEFWSLPFLVTPNVLIPRPDTELLVETALNHLADSPGSRILELGTGSGAIALALAHSRPLDTIVATDISSRALAVARSNQERLSKSHQRTENLSFVQSNWYDSLNTEPFDLIVSNPPYIDLSDPHVTTSVRQYEPESALFSGNDGLEDIELIIEGAASCLKPGGRILLEHGWQQHKRVSQCYADNGYVNITSCRDPAGHDRVTGATREEN